MFEDIDFGEGIVIFNADQFDPNANFEEQILLLNEDLFQVGYDIQNIHYTIDVGWYPESSINGCFMIVIVKNSNWEGPLYKKRTRDYKQLNKYMEESIEIIMNLTKISK
jgi:hypothetical protein